MILMKEFDVLVVGELNIDLILNNIEGYPQMSKEILARNFTLTTGSSSAIFASNISVLDVDVAFCGIVGNDLFGDMIVQQLNRKNVDTRYIFHKEGYGTGATTVLNYGGDRMMVTYPGPMEELKASDISEDLLRRAGHLHISSIFLQKGLKESLLELLHSAKQNGLTISLDPQWDPAEQWELDLDALLPLIDVFLPNKKELLLLTNEDSLDAAVQKLSKYPGVIVVKDGEHGAVWSHQGVISREEAYLNTDVVDAIGAGDSFDAGFISQFIQGKSIQECVQYGNLIGAVSTTAAGGTGAFESLEKVLRTGKERFSVTSYPKIY